jgi:hypothetical protein
MSPEMYMERARTAHQRAAGSFSPTAKSTWELVAWQWEWLGHMARRHRPQPLPGTVDDVCGLSSAQRRTP